MMFYYISFVILARRSDPILMSGPEDFDIEGEFRQFKKRIEEELGTEPSFLVPKSDWALRALETLRKFQQEYNCTGDYEGIFIEHLIQRCGFERSRCIDVRLA